MTKETGETIAWADYDTWGVPLSPVDFDMNMAGVDNVIGFTSYTYDTVLDIYFAQARFYDQNDRRFTQQDPIKDGVNWFAYCGNSPTKNIDPSGLCYYDKDGRWKHDNWEYTGGYTRKSDPRSSFFTAAPIYEPEAWNTEQTQIYTNCYSYAFDMKVNPLTGNNFPIGGMQPGMLSGELSLQKFLSDPTAMESYPEIYSGTRKGNEKLVDMVRADAKAVGLDFVPYKDGLTGGYKVALVVAPGEDYHWYRQDTDGTWSHKQGIMPISQSVGYSEDKYGILQFNCATLTDPKKDAKKVGYTSFVGYFYIKSSEK